MIDEPLSITTIAEIKMSQMDEKYKKHVYGYLESLGCVVTPLPTGEHKIAFPTGTQEMVYAGRSTQWTYTTTILFPTGQKLMKYVSASLSNQRDFQTMLAFPNEILEPS